ncbi:hypothetical protein ACHAWU_007458 [Discostella pseudostelligera]|uniref:Uncharacterized protein n=1 Tax=Discostella pseudostelligera TaxID=259834 RepID=A0ABD3MRL9_9STRA
MAMAEAYYTPKLQKRTLKGHSGPVLCLTHSSERLVIRNHPRRHRRGHSVVDAKSTATTSASAVDDRRPQPASSLEDNLHTQDHSNYHASLLLSGSADGTVRLWDLRTRKTSICIHVPKNAENGGDSGGGGGNEVTSVAFHPLLEDDENINDYDYEDENNINNKVEGEVSEVCAPDVHCGSSSSSGEYTIYASTSNFVYGYDLRYYHLHNQQQKISSNNIGIRTPSTSTTSTMRIIQGPPHFDLTPLFQCTDEINQLSFTFRRNANSHTAAASSSGGGGRDRRYDIFLSAADDSGEVHIIENPPNRRCYDTTIASSPIGNNSIHREHNGDDINKPTILCHAEPHTLGIASCASFQPRASYSSSSSSTTPSSALLLATGGTDCTVKLWDISHCTNTSSSTSSSSSSQRRKHRKQQQFKPRPPRLTSTMTISPYESGSGGGGDDGGKLWNPPYIHSLSWSASGQFLAAGIGDGSVSIYRVEGKVLTGIGRLGRNEDICNDDEEARAGHGSAVASVRFAYFGSGGRYRGVGGINDADDRLLLSAGNDGTIICWDLGGNMVGRGPLDPMQYLRSPPASGGGGGGCSENEPIGIGDDNDDFTPSPPRVLFKIAHRHKPNWMTCSPFFNNDNTSSSCNYSPPSLPGTIFVADVTKDISAYTLAEI